MAEKIAIVVPEGEVYSFTRKFFFHIFNTTLAPFASKLVMDNLKEQGYYLNIYPGEKNKILLSMDTKVINIEDYKEIANIETILIIVDKSRIIKNNDNKISLFISFAEPRMELDKLIDISELKDYYNFDLNFDENVKSIMNDREVYI